MVQKLHRNLVNCVSLLALTYAEAEHGARQTVSWPVPVRPEQSVGNPTQGTLGVLTQKQCC